MNHEGDTGRNELVRNTSTIFQAFVITLLMMASAISDYAQTPAAASSLFLYGTQDPRKIADVGVDAELWAVTLVRQPSLSTASSDAPQTLTLIVRTVKLKGIPELYLGYPEGTELKLGTIPPWIIILGGKAKTPEFVGPFPDCTKLEVRLTHRANGAYETVYYFDESIGEREPYRTGPRPQQLY
jgi:hypothetical protein